MTLGVRSIHVPEIANAVSVTRSTILYPILSPMKPIFSKNIEYSAEIKKLIPQNSVTNPQASKKEPCRNVSNYRPLIGDHSLVTFNLKTEVGGLPLTYKRNQLDMECNAVTVRL